MTQLQMTPSAHIQDPFGLERFVIAQASIYSQVLAELHTGQKRSHWMWFVFPQFDGLGSSETARFYSIKSREEAVSYLQHPTLGPRLSECSEAILAVPEKTAREIFGCPDDLKLRSSMTLFMAVSPPESIFSRVIARCFEGRPDQRTLDLMGTPD